MYALLSFGYGLKSKAYSIRGSINNTFPNLYKYHTMKNFIFLAIFCIAALLGHSQNSLTAADFSAKKIVNTIAQDSTKVLVYSKSQGVRVAYIADLKPYSEYEATLVQSSTTAPVATLLHNNIPGGIGTWARTGVGVYTYTLPTSALTASKVLFMGSLPPNTTIVRTSATVITLSTFTINTTTAADAILNGHSLAIRVYR
jgi:hypothetical protein